MSICLWQDMLQKINDSITATTVLLKGIEGEKEKKIQKDKGNETIRHSFAFYH